MVYSKFSPFLTRCACILTHRIPVPSNIVYVACRIMYLVKKALFALIGGILRQNRPAKSQQRSLVILWRTQRKHEAFRGAATLGSATKQTPQTLISTQHPQGGQSRSPHPCAKVKICDLILCHELSPDLLTLECMRRYMQQDQMSDENSHGTRLEACMCSLPITAYPIWLQDGKCDKNCNNAACKYPCNVVVTFFQYSQPKNAKNKQP